MASHQEEPALSSDDAERFNRLYRRAWNLSRGSMLLGAVSSTPRVGWFERRRLRRAIDAFGQALAIHPASWQSLFGLGKTHQRLGEHAGALECFERALAINPGHVDLEREASFSARDAGQMSKSLEYSRQAAAGNPADHGLWSNLALVELLSGNLDEARRAIQEALAREPADPINRNVAAMIDDVASGRRAQPRTVAEL